GAGITLHESLAAAEALADEGIAARVIDLYSVKPIDAATLVEAAEATGGLVVAEDHWPEGGIRDAVLEVLVDAGANVPVTSLAPTGMPTSGTPAQLLDQAGIDSAHIVVFFLMIRRPPRSTLFPYTPLIPAGARA